MGIICLHTPTKSSLAVILRGQRSFYDNRFRRYGFCDIFCPARAVSGLFPANRPWPKIWHIFFLTLLDSYDQFLKRKWICMEVHTGGNSAPRVNGTEEFWEEQKPLSTEWQFFCLLTFNSRADLITRYKFNQVNDIFTFSIDFMI